MAKVVDSIASSGPNHLPKKYQFISKEINIEASKYKSK